MDILPDLPIGFMKNTELYLVSKFIPIWCNYDLMKAYDICSNEFIVNVSSIQLKL